MNSRGEVHRSDLEVAQLSHPGAERTRNEDCLITDADEGLFIVADGIGGRPAGDLASRLAVEEIHRFLTAGRQDDVRIDLEDALLSAHAHIRRVAETDRHHRGMGTTALVAWIFKSPRTAWLAHVGNCRAYRFRAGALEQLTEDHTLLQTVRRAGMLPADSGDWPPREMLSQALGSSELIAPDIREIDVREKDLLLLCTDGVSDVLEECEILEALSGGGSLQDALARLLVEVNRKGAPDNLTAVLIRVSGRETAMYGPKMTGLTE